MPGFRDHFNLAPCSIHEVDTLWVSVRLNFNCFERKVDNAIVIVLQITTQAQQQQQQQQQVSRSITPPPTVLQVVASPRQQPTAVATTATAAVATVSPSGGKVSPAPRPIAPRTPSPAPAQQQPVIISNSTVLFPQQPQLQLATTPMIIPKLENVTLGGMTVSALSSGGNVSQMQRHSLTPEPSSLLSPSETTWVPVIQGGDSPARPSSAPVPGHLAESSPDYIPFSTDREVPQFLVSVTPPPAPPLTEGQPGGTTQGQLGGTLAQPGSTTQLPGGTLAQPGGTIQGQPGGTLAQPNAIPQAQPNVPAQAQPGGATTSLGSTGSQFSISHRNVQLFSPSQQHAYEGKQKFSPSQAQRSSPSPYYNPRTMSPAKVSPLVHSGSRGSSPAPSAETPAKPRSREPSPAPSRSRDVSPARLSSSSSQSQVSPVPKLVVPDVGGKGSTSSTNQGSSTTTTATSRHKPNPLNLPTSSLTSLPIPSPGLFQPLKSGGLATPCLANMTPNTITGFTNLPTPMMLTSPIHLGGAHAQRTPIMPLHFWSSLSPVATLSPRVGGGSNPGGTSTFQFPSYMNGGPMAFSPVVTIPAFTAFENLQTPSGVETVAAPSS